MLIGKIRKEQKKSQVWMAYQLGMSQPRYSQIERGLYKPSETERIKIAKTLECNIDEVDYPNEPLF